MFSGIGSAESDSKRAFLATIHKSKVKAISLEDWTVTPQRQTVVVIGEATLKEDKGNSIPIAFMNVFVKRKGHWQVLASYIALNSSGKAETDEQ